MNSLKDGFLRPAAIPPGESGLLHSVPAEPGGWGIGFSVRRLVPGEVWKGSTGHQESAIVVLSGVVRIDWGAGPHTIGKRQNVFAGFPYALYLPTGASFEVCSETIAELAESRASSELALQPRLYTPADVGSEIRGGGVTTRQIVRIIRPEHAADKLMMNEVFTPGGNWSSYPPHKHDSNNPPAESKLHELYYFRVDHPDGFGLLRLYDAAGTEDVNFTIRDGDLILLREGYHLVAAAPGYSVYYLAVLAGSVRSLSARTDPRYDHLRTGFGPSDPRMPVVSLG